MFPDHQTCVNFVEQSYFGNLRNSNIEAAMSCFIQRAEVIIRHGDNPERVFLVGADEKVSDLQEFYEHLCGNYDVWFGDFSHFIDLAAQKSACHFKVKLTPRADGLYAGAGIQELRNCNFFEYRDSLIRHMIIYYSNPQVGAPGSNDGVARPTGYPA